MLTLSTPAKLDIEVPTSSADKNARYTIKLDGQVIFEGKIFIEHDADITSPTKFLNINVSDILRNYKYEGEGLIEPVWEYEYYNYPNIVTQQPINHYICIVDVEVEGSLAGEYYVLLQDFTPSVNLEEVMSVERPLLLDVTKALPRLPKISTNNYYFGLAYHSESPEIEVNGIVMQRKPHTSSNDNVSTYPLKNLLLGGDDAVYVNGAYKVAEFDQCPRDYYLCWQVGASWFSYGFDGLAEAVRSYERVDIKDSDDNMNRVQTKVTKGWKLNSGFINDGYQEAFDWLFRSKWVGVYETATDTFRYVNVKNADFTWKTNMREMKNVTVEVEERTKYIG